MRGGTGLTNVPEPEIKPADWVFEVPYTSFTIEFIYDPSKKEDTEKWERGELVVEEEGEGEPTDVTAEAKEPERVEGAAGAAEEGTAEQAEASPPAPVGGAADGEQGPSQAEEIADTEEGQET